MHDRIARLAYALVYPIARHSTKSQVAKLFTNGRSQAVRLPAACRFEAKEVFIRKDRKTGDAILSRKPANWNDFFLALESVSVPAGFLGRKERKQGAQQRDPLEGWCE